MGKKLLLKLKCLNKDDGFTIVELMIALSVLSIILVTASLVMIQVGKLYSKGVNAADLQNINRTVIADITSALQFSGNPPLNCTGNPCPRNYNNVKVNSFCIDTTRYSYIVGSEQGTDQGFSPLVITPHVLWRDTMTTNGSCDPVNITQSSIPGNGYDMLADHMRLSQFMVTPDPSVSGVYTVNISLAFGDNDLLNSTWTNCNGGAGDQFCSTSSITSTVTRRTSN